MKQIGIRELKNRLSATIQEVKNGETVLVTERGKTVAVLKRESLDPIERKLTLLHEKKLIRLGEGGKPEGLALKRKKVKGAPLAKAVIEERR
jgi:prevent-host-death family protein